MKDLLQELWDEYRILITDIDTVISGMELDENIENLTRITDDTEMMVELRDKLYNAGIKNIPGCSITK